MQFLIVLLHSHLNETKNEICHKINTCRTREADPTTGAIMTPIYRDLYIRSILSPGQHTGYEYSRTGNPLQELL